MDGSNVPIKRRREDEESLLEGLRFKVGKFGSQGVSEMGVEAASSSGTPSGACSNPFERLGPELVDMIFQFLPKKDLITRVALVDSRFFGLTQGTSGHYTHEGRKAYLAGDFIEAARYFVNVSVDTASVTTSEVTAEEGSLADASNVSDARDGLAKCLMQMRFLGDPELNNCSDEALLAMSQPALRALWVDHVESAMAKLINRSRKDLVHEIYDWSHKTAIGNVAGQPISDQERLYSCERIIFLMLYSKDNAVRKDAMLALIRVAREMHGEGGIQKILVEQSIGKVVDFIRKSGGLEAVSAIAKIVFENLERHDCSYIAKDALLRALHDAFNTVSKELEALVERRSVLRASVDDILKDNPCACEIKAIEANLEDHASLIAEVNRLNDEKHELSWFLTAMPSGEQRSQSSVEERIRVACTRLHELREIINDISTLVERRNNLQPLAWMGMADEAEVQELAFIEERLHGLGSVRDEIEGLNSDVQSCKRQLELLKIEARLNDLSESMNKVQALQERKHELESIVNERLASEPAAQELKQVNERIATLDTFTQGIIKQVSAGVARQKISEDSIQARALRGMLVNALYDLCLVHPESKKNFNKLGDLFVYMIEHNLHLEESERIELKERLLALEQLHRTPERSQKINMWLFRIGTSDLTFPGGATVAEDALVTWLDRISDARGRLSEPFPLARVGRLADALQSPHLTLESRLRIWTLLKPQLDLLAKGAQRDAERMSILQSFSKSALVLLDKPGSRLSELQFQRDIFAYIEQLSSWIPEDWSAATAILTSLHSGIPHAVRAAL